MSTVNSKLPSQHALLLPEQKRFVQLCLLMSLLCAIPLYTHPLGIDQPNAWMFSTLNYLLPFILLFRFQRPKWFKWGEISIGNIAYRALQLEILLGCLLGWSVLIGDFQIDWTFHGFREWTEIQIGHQIEHTQSAMPTLPAEVETIAKWAFWGSWLLPWLTWWVALPQEVVWRGWIADRAQRPRDWMILGGYWTLWQLPFWLVSPQWHLGWWTNNGNLFLQQVLSTWLIGACLVGFRQYSGSLLLTAFTATLLTTSESWAILLQKITPFPNWMWIGWNGWWGCILMLCWLGWQHRTSKHSSEAQSMP